MFDLSLTTQLFSLDLYRAMRWRSIGPFHGSKERAGAGVPGQPNLSFLLERQPTDSLFDFPVNSANFGPCWC
jgi:hypothetical protein